jgi:CDP-2,3-bis-(O-geranylgeranyl)-sn-glycerol synthase
VGYEDWLGLGLRFGVGAMAGDSVKSLIKRRVGVAPGRPWIPFDQLDFVLGALVLVWPVAGLGWADAVVILALSPLGHVAVNYVGYWLGVRDTRW